MAFQPFGYRFEVSSSMTLAEAKSAIRSKKTGMFDAKNGARGWIAGPFICLWFSAFDQYGPMLFGLISADRSGTRVHGRAGSDLNGVVMLTLLIPLMAWLFVQMGSEGPASGRELLIMAVFLIGVPLTYWWAHSERKDAEPLERFLRNALAQPSARSKSKANHRTFQKGLRLIVNGDYVEGPSTEEALNNALLRVGNHDFLIIELTQQDYLQTACRDGRYVLEVRRGGPSEHYQAVRNGVPTGKHATASKDFTYEEVLATMVSYALGEALPNFLHLEPLKLDR